jgi:hypothetical protein
MAQKGTREHAWGVNLLVTNTIGWHKRHIGQPIVSGSISIPVGGISRRVRPGSGASLRELRFSPEQI